MKIYSLLFLLFPFLAFSQGADCYVSVPVKYEFQKKANEYRLNELTKFLLEKQGFKVFFENEFPDLGIEPCNVLKANVLNTSGMFTSKLQFTLTDCKGQQVFASEVGKSREKEFTKAYQEALRNAFATSDKLANFKKECKSATQSIAENKQLIKQEPPVQVPAPAEVSDATKDNTLLYAQPTDEGFQLVDNTPKVVLKIQKTSLPDVYVAQDAEGNQGLLFKNAAGDYVFEFTKDGNVERKILNVKF
ncbi:hypothetical protein [Capnocytophaga sp.]|uniref:hypothetical protein n=1 Tax=Capnocytophaga sp. TaxID=44737 RepID=UPI0026DD6C73|nr:hypothetical protein [Capnocytophaga sp.]MDO5104578.1 hypothetical protein [Capnocytophaga sp.]